MFERWRQENFFKYLSEEYALDALVDYRVEPDDPAREVPNPRWNALDAELRRAREIVRHVFALYGVDAAANRESVRRTMRGFKIANASGHRAILQALKHYTKIEAKRAAVPKRVPVQNVVEGTVIKLAAERKHLTSLIKMVPSRERPRPRDHAPLQARRRRSPHAHPDRPRLARRHRRRRQRATRHPRAPQLRTSNECGRRALQRDQSARRPVPRHRLAPALRRRHAHRPLAVTRRGPARAGGKRTLSRRGMSGGLKFGTAKRNVACTMWLVRRMASPTRYAWFGLLSIGKAFFLSPMRWRAAGALSVIIVLLLTLNALNVANRYVGRNFITAIALRDRGQYFRFAILYMGVFAASAATGVSQQFVQDRLALSWRDWLTRHLIDRYLAGHTFDRISAKKDIDNPDQRIAEDVHTFYEHPPLVRRHDHKLRSHYPRLRRRALVN